MRAMMRKDVDTTNMIEAVSILVFISPIISISQACVFRGCLNLVPGEFWVSHVGEC